MDISPPSSQSRALIQILAMKIQIYFFEANLSALNEGLGDTEVNKSYSLSANAGYKQVFDNLDKNVKPKHMRTDNQTKSLHFVQSYATRDRVDFSRYSNEAPTHSMSFPLKRTTNRLKQIFQL